MRTTRRNRLAALAGLAAALALVLAACGSDDDAAAPVEDDAPAVGEPERGGKVVFGIDAETDGYNPVTNRFAHAGHLVASAVYDPLATLDEEGNAVPYLAESIEPNADFTEWTITLPTDVEFHNGDPLTAEAVAEVLEAHRTGLVTSATILAIQSIEVVDDQTLVITLDQPWADFPIIFTTQVGYVMSPTMLTDPDSAARPIGTGPFQFAEWDRGSSWRGVRNENYWRTDEDGEPLPYLDEIEFRVIPDHNARQAALEAGDVDLIHTLDPESVLELRETDFVVTEWDRGEEDLIALNVEVPPFDNIHARRALAHATDQATFIVDKRAGVYIEVNGPFAPGQLGFATDTGYPEYDPDAARAELEEYGQPLSFVLNCTDDVIGLGICQYLVEMWAEVGIEAEIDAMAQADVIFNAVTGQFEATRWRNWGQPDPDADYAWWHSTSVRSPEEGITINIARLQDDEIDEALDLARSITNDERRDEAYQLVAEKFGELVPYVWLGRVVWAVAGPERVHGWQIGGRNGTLATIGPKTWVGEIWVD